MNGTNLTDREQGILDFEREWWKYAGAKEDEIRRRFDVSPTRYYQQLHALLDRPEALSYAPTTVARLQRLRRVRSARRKQPVKR